MHATAAVNVWVLTDETVADTCETMSFVGFYSTPEKAKAYLARWYMDAESAATIAWEQGEHNPNFWEGHTPDHHACFLLTRHDLSGIDNGG